MPSIEGPAIEGRGNEGAIKKVSGAMENRPPELLSDGSRPSKPEILEAEDMGRTKLKPAALEQSAGERLFVVLCSSGFESAEGVRSALMFATLAALSDHRAVLFCVQGAVDVMVKGAVERSEIPSSGAPRIARRLAEALEAGVEILCCSQTAANKGLSQDDFIQGVRIAGAMELIEMSGRAETVLSF